MKEAKIDPTTPLSSFFTFVSVPYYMVGPPLYILVGCEKKLIKGLGGGGLEIFVI